MKLKLDIDCTPEELRGFFGLPQVKPLQESLMASARSGCAPIIKAMDPEAMLKTWLPAGLKGLNSCRRCFFRGWGSWRQTKIAVASRCGPRACCCARGATRTSRLSPRCPPIRLS